MQYASYPLLYWKVISDSSPSTWSHYHYRELIIPCKLDIHYLNCSQFLLNGQKIVVGGIVGHPQREFQPRVKDTRGKISGQIVSAFSQVLSAVASM